MENFNFCAVIYDTFQLLSDVFPQVLILIVTKANIEKSYAQNNKQDINLRNDID